MRRLKKILPVAALIGLCALIFLLRLRTYDERLERDLTAYAVIAHEMLNGKNLYGDLWDRKPTGRLCDLRGRGVDCRIWPQFDLSSERRRRRPRDD
jgi:hypothetical protein